MDTQVLLIYRGTMKIVLGLIAFCLVIPSLNAGTLMKKRSKTIKLAFPAAKTIVSVNSEADSKEQLPSEDFDISIINDFKVPQSIEKDAEERGFKLSDLKTWKGNEPQKDPYYIFKFPWGHVYTWQTPTKGSASFSYICRSKDAFCFKVGPYQSLYWDFNWRTVSFSDLNPKK